MVLLAVLGVALAALLARPVAASVLVNGGNLGLIHSIDRDFHSTGIAAAYEPAGQLILQRAIPYERWFRAAASIDPDDDRAYSGLSKVFSAAENYDAAFAAARQAVALGGSRRHGLLAGSIAAYSGNSNMARDIWLSAAPSVADRLALARLLFGQSHWDKADYHPERWDDAIWVLDQTRKFPNLVEADLVRLNLRLADYREHISDLDGAADALERALAISPASPALLSRLAYVRLRQGEIIEAREVAIQALNHEPVWLAHYVLGLAARSGCDLAGARAAFEAGLKLTYDGDYRYYWQYDALASVYLAEGRREEAITAWEALVKFQPGTESVVERLESAVAGGSRCDGGRAQ